MPDPAPSPMPDVAVVIPFHFGGAFVDATIESVRAQRGVEWSVVVAIDGASDDEEIQLARWAEDETRCTLVRTAGSQGPAARATSARQRWDPMLIT